MNKTLGIDLGTNSLGWAILDDITGDILDKGVLVFPEGIDAANDTLETPAAIRRSKRMGRRLKFRRKMRKWVMLRILIDNGMCPMTVSELETWKRDGKYPVGNKSFIDWLKSTDTSNPYRDRAAAATEKVPRPVLGRALYHIAQRRGFKSSRKDGGEEEGAPRKDIGVVKNDIAALTKEISDAGCRTLGQYFCKVLDTQRNGLEKVRVRTRHTGRIQHYMTEFSVIMEVQGVEKKLREKLYDALFLQRPLRSQKHLVGVCPLEPKSPRAQIGHPAYEEFRMLSFVNNLSFENVDTGEKVPLTDVDRKVVAGAFMKTASTMKFKDISKLFKKKFAAEHLKFHYYRDDESVSCCSTRHRIASAFGETPYDEQMVFDALSFYDDDEKLADWFRRHYPALSEEQIKGVCKIHPKEGNAQYSLKAINRILPFLREGHDLFTARFMAKLPDVIPDFAANKEMIELNLKELNFKYRQNRELYREDRVRRREKPLRLMDMYREYFLERWGVQDDAWKQLYLHGDSVYKVDDRRPERLPAVNLGMIRNPLVQRSMTTLRRLVNYLRDHGKIDGETTIRVELARGVNDFATRHALQQWNKTREQERDGARAEIVKLGLAVTEDAVDRYVLWEEQEHKCLYTGEPINVVDLFNGEKVDVEHTIPRSKSGDDSLANKTICLLSYNRNTKRGRVPTECPNYENTIWLNCDLGESA